MGVGSQRHAPADLPTGKPGTHCIRGWVGPRADLDGCGKSRPQPGFDRRTVQPIASHYTDWAIPALQKQSTFSKLRNIPTALSVFSVQGKCYFILHTS